MELRQMLLIIDINKYQNKYAAHTLLLLLLVNVQIQMQRSSIVLHI